MKLLITVVMLTATFLTSAGETDRLACDSFRAVHGARYTKLKDEAEGFLTSAGPAHRANQNFLNKALSGLKTLTKKYQNLFAHLGQDTGEMRKILMEEYTMKVKKILNQTGLSDSWNLRSVACPGNSYDICRVVNDVYLTGDDSIPWNPTLEFQVFYLLPQHRIRDYDGSIGLTKVDLLNGTAKIGTAFDAKIRSSQLALEKASAQGKSENDLVTRRANLEEAKINQRIMTQTRRQFIDAELTPEQRLACGMVASVAGADSTRVVSHARSFQFAATPETVQFHSAGHTKQR